MGRNSNFGAQSPPIPTMAGHLQSPFVSSNAPIAPTPASASASPGHFDQQFYATHPVTMPELTHYDLSYDHFFAPNDMHPSLGHDQFFERQGCMTPLSQHSMVDGSSGASDIAGPGLPAHSFEVMSSHSMSSPVTFITPTWTPEPMQLEAHSREASLQAASPRPLPLLLPRHQHSNSTESTMTIKAPPAPLVFAPIAPHPTTPRQKPSLKRTASREELTQQSPQSKRKRSASPTTSSPITELSAEDELLLRLKDQENLTWREIQGRFEVELNKTFHVPALQMRLKRLRERMRVWTEHDLEALRLAYDYWFDNRFEIIAQKMLELGAQEKWSSKQCEKKWREIAPLQDYFQPSVHSTPGLCTPTLQHTMHPLAFCPPPPSPFPMVSLPQAPLPLAQPQPLAIEPPRFNHPLSITSA